ncbi:hypothetical protein BJX70DRAFT_206702 [Aspergillus crustosus]
MQHCGAHCLWSYYKTSMSYASDSNADYGALGAEEAADNKGTRPVKDIGIEADNSGQMIHRTLRVRTHYSVCLYQPVFRAIPNHQQPTRHATNSTPHGMLCHPSASRCLSVSFDRSTPSTSSKTLTTSPSPATPAQHQPCPCSQPPTTDPAPSDQETPNRPPPPQQELPQPRRAHSLPQRLARCSLLDRILILDLDTRDAEEEFHHSRLPVCSRDAQRRKVAEPRLVRVYFTTAQQRARDPHIPSHRSNT